MKSVGWGVIETHSGRDGSKLDNPRIVKGYSSEASAKRVATGYGRKRFDHVELFIRDE